MDKRYILIKIDEKITHSEKCEFRNKIQSNDGVTVILDPSTCEDEMRWMKPDELTIESPEPSELKSVDVETFAAKLHEFAADLSKTVQLQLIWISNDSWPDVEEEGLELYGALKRLTAWHNARIVMLHKVENITPESTGCKWAELIGAQFMSYDEYKQSYEAPIWQGSLNIHNTEMDQSIVLPNFVLLRNKPAFSKYKWMFQSSTYNNQTELSSVLLDKSMHFLTSIYIRDIPAFYITGQTYIIDVAGYGAKNSRSFKFLSPLLENRQLGYLVRICHGSRSGTFSLENSSKTWHDCLVENIHNIQEPHANTGIDDEGEVINLLLCSGQGNDGSHVIKAHVVRSPNEIDGKLAVVFANLENKCLSEQSEDNKENIAVIGEALDKLPHYRAETFIKLETMIQEAQMQALRQWIESCKKGNTEFVLTGGDLLYLLSATRQRFMARYREQHGELPTEPRPKRARKRPYEELKISYDTKDMLERKILEHQNKLREKMQRMTSNENLAGLSPPKDAHVIKLNANELLKYFNSDGTPVESELEPILIKKSRLRRYDSGESRADQWPLCSHYKYHDIYYNVGVSPEKSAQKAQRLAERLRKVETVNTCSQPNDDCLLVTSSSNSASSQTKRSRRRGNAEMGPETGKSVDRKSRRSIATPRRQSITTPPRKRSGLRHTPTSVERRRKLSLSNARTTPRGESSEKPLKKRARPSEDYSTPVATQPRPLVVKTEPIARTKPLAKSVPDSEKGNTPRSEGKESRSARHKKKLEETVKLVLGEHNVTEEENKELFSRCYSKLYQLTFTQAKTLKSSAGLRQEMLKTAREHAEMVVVFEQMKLAKEKA